MMIRRRKLTSGIERLVNVMMRRDPMMLLLLLLLLEKASMFFVKGEGLLIEILRLEGMMGNPRWLLISLVGLLRLVPGDGGQERKLTAEGKLLLLLLLVIGVGRELTETERGDGGEIGVDLLLTSLDDVMGFGDLLRRFMMTGRRRGKAAAAGALFRRRRGRRKGGSATGRRKPGRGRRRRL